MASGASIRFYASSAWRALRKACLERDGLRCVVPGCVNRATHADHIARRPIAATLTPADHLDNLRSLCATHDAQVKELANGCRRNGGRFRVMGADRDGWPLDPIRRRDERDSMINNKK